MIKFDYSAKMGLWQLPSTDEYIAAITLRLLQLNEQTTCPIDVHQTNIENRATEIPLASGGK